MTSAPTPVSIVKVLPDLLRRVPEAIRGYIYLAGFIAAVAFIVTSLIVHGLTWDQLYALVLAALGLLAKANTGTSGPAYDASEAESGE